MAKVSVVIPTYNRGGYIQDAIETVLAQTYEDVEVIVVDDGSTDDTADKVKRISLANPGKIKYFYQENGGISSARNKGISNASGEFIAFLDSDDLWQKDKLEKQVKAFDDPQVGLLYSYAEYVDIDTGEKVIKPAVGYTEFEDFINSYTILPTSSVVARREALLDVGCFDEEISVFEDIYLWRKIACKFKVCFMDDVLAVHRLHNSNISKDDKKVFLNSVKVYKKMLIDYAGIISSQVLKSKVRFYSYLLGREEFKDKKYNEARQAFVDVFKYFTFSDFFNGKGIVLYFKSIVNLLYIYLKN